jgi:hypothetical protein
MRLIVIQFQVLARLLRISIAAYKLLNCLLYDIFLILMEDIDCIHLEFLILEFLRFGCDIIMLILSYFFHFYKLEESLFTITNVIFQFC